VIRTLAVGCSGAALFVFLAWALGQWSGAYLAGGATFCAVLFISHFLWPLVRASRRESRTFG